MDRRTGLSPILASSRHILGRGRRLVLDVRDLKSGYGSLEILHSISVRVHQKHLVAILGPNGVGKSTLLRSIVGLARVWEPSVIRFKGEDITGVPTESLARRG